jgi:hypothetical protein
MEEKKAGAGVEVQLHSLLSSVLKGGKRSASRPGFAPGKASRYPLNKGAGWAPRDELGNLDKSKKILFVGGVSNHIFSVTILAEPS